MVRQTPTGIARSADESKWAARLVGAGSLLTLIYELAYLWFDWRSLWLGDRRPLLLHAVNIGLYLAAVLMTLRVGPWLKRHWKKVAFSFSTILILSSTELAIITRNTEPLVVALMLFLAGTGPFLSWGERAQGLLSVVALGAFAIASSRLPSAQSDPYQWLGILIAAAIGLFSTALERRLHRARRLAEEEALRIRELLVNQERLRVAGQLASGIAHDLANSLNVIRLRLQSLVTDDNVTAKHEAALRTIQHAVEDAALTVARVRELGRTRIHHKKESTQISEVITEVIELVRMTTEGRSSLDSIRIKIRSQIPETLPRVNGSASELRQVFLNLLLNAYEAIPDGGEITVAATSRNNTVVVTVADTGPGIATQDLQRIFDPFFTTKGPGGTGLGLSIAKNIVEALGGTIAASNGSNGGAIFKLEFPKASPHQSGNRADARARLSSRLLLIDDDLQSLEALKQVLLLQGHYADTAQSGAEALKKIASAKYDIVLCDLAMPEMNGWTVARSALQIDPKLNFYIVTGWGALAEGEIPPDLPLRGILSKPIDLAELAGVLSESIRNEIAGASEET